MMHPNDSVSQSYSDTYARSKNLPKNLPMTNSTKAILTDRGQYINYLEAQLDRLSGALLSHDSLQTKMQELEKKQLEQDDRVQNVMKITRLSQSFAER